MGRFEVGEEVPPLRRTSDFANWNRYAAVNDEFIDVHMSGDAARRAGQPDVFGMGNLRIAYVHCALHDWLDGEGEISSFSCQFRAMNFLGDTLTSHGRVTGTNERDGTRVVELDVGVTNQDGVETMPGRAEVVLFRDGEPVVLPEAPLPEIPARDPGVYLDETTIGWLGRSVDPVVSLPVGANEIRRWAQAVYYPDPPPGDLYDEVVASKGPWGGLVAPRDFNPFAWNPDYHPDVYPWMRGMGTEPGYRGLNGGQRNDYFAPIRPGDVITCVATLVDAYEKEGRLGTMMFLIDEQRLTNQRGELVRVGLRTSIYH